ncbi:MAG: alpha/beta hydrolase [Fuerstia sp.]|nr:alpha/beta hydrolase [Fuerstiella sp.]
MTVFTALFAVCFAPLATDPVDAEFEVRERIVYSKVADRELLLDAWVPGKDGAHPAVLVVHGGAWRSGNRKQLRGYANSLAKRGFACFAIDYRLAPDDKFPAQIDDCREAVKWIRANAKEYKVNPDKLGAIGYSAGGHLVCLLATTGEAPSDKNGHVDTRIQCVAAGGAPTDFRTAADNGRWAWYWMGGDLTTAPEKFHDASATAFVDKDDPPIFFFNGTADELVPIEWSLSCYDALKASGVKTEMHKIEGAGHLFAAMNPEALDKAYTFLQQELQGEPAVPAEPISPAAPETE